MRNYQKRRKHFLLCIAWGKASKTTLKPLQTLMNRAIRIMSFAPFGNINLQPLYEILELLSIEQTYSLEVAKFAYRDKNSLFPTKIATYFEFTRRDIVRVTRQSASSTLQFSSNSSLGMKSIRKVMSRAWEEIPEEIKKSNWLKSFKRMYKSHLILIGWN